MPLLRHRIFSGLRIIIMYVNELLQTAQYVTDHQGQRQAVLLDMSVWETLIQQLTFTSDNSVDTARQTAMAREEAAYQLMHAELLIKYTNQHVAIYHEKLIDHDKDAAQLYKRVRQQYADEFVLITPVELEAEEAYQILSPHVTMENQRA